MAIILTISDKGRYSWKLAIKCVIKTWHSKSVFLKPSRI